MKRVPPEAISDLRRRLSSLAPRSTERRLLVEETAGLYGVSTDTLYRALRERAVPKPLRRCDHGVPRVMGATEMERFCEVVAAIKVRTSNKKGRHLSPAEAIRLLEDYDVQTPDGPVRAANYVVQTPPYCPTSSTAAPASSLVRWYGRSGISARGSLKSPAGTRPKQAMAGSTSTAAG
jgi:hypothetical protein